LGQTYHAALIYRDYFSAHTLNVKFASDDDSAIDEMTFEIQAGVEGKEDLTFEVSSFMLGKP